MAPSLYQNDLGKYYVHAPTTFTKGAQTSVYKAVMTDNKDSVLWIQPITSYQTKSFSSIVNDWNGRSIKIQDSTEEGKQYIMTPMLGAGKKDENGFSGVLLGDVGNEDGSTPVTGIYGYGQDEQSFAFKEDGTAFIGKNGEGRIEFDGNQGIIKSANFDGVYNAKNLFLFEEQNIKNFTNTNNINYWQLLEYKKQFILPKNGYNRILHIWSNEKQTSTYIAIPLNLMRGSQYVLSYKCTINNIIINKKSNNNNVDYIRCSMRITARDEKRITPTDLKLNTTKFDIQLNQETYICSNSWIADTEIYYYSLLHFQPIDILEIVFKDGTSLSLSDINDLEIEFFIQEIQLEMSNNSIATIYEAPDLANINLNYKYPTLLNKNNEFHNFGNTGSYINLNSGTLITNNLIARNKGIIGNWDIDNYGLGDIFSAFTKKYNNIMIPASTMYSFVNDGYFTYPVFYTGLYSIRETTTNTQNQYLCQVNSDQYEWEQGKLANGSPYYWKNYKDNIWYIKKPVSNDASIEYVLSQDIILRPVSEQLGFSFLGEIKKNDMNIENSVISTGFSYIASREEDEKYYILKNIKLFYYPDPVNTNELWSFNKQENGEGYAICYNRQNNISFDLSARFEIKNYAYDYSTSNTPDSQQPFGMLLLRDGTALFNQNIYYKGLKGLTGWVVNKDFSKEQVVDGTNIEVKYTTFYYYSQGALVGYLSYHTGSEFGFETNLQDLYGNQPADFDPNAPSKPNTAWKPKYLH